MNQDGTVPLDIWRPGKNVKVVVHGYNSNLASIMDLLEAHKMNVLAKGMVQRVAYCSINTQSKVCLNLVVIFSEQSTQSTITI